MDQQLLDAAAYTLAVWGLEDHQERLLADHDGLALLALLCNQAAKLAEARGEHERPAAVCRQAGAAARRLDSP